MKYAFWTLVGALIIAALVCLTLGVAILVRQT